MRPFLGKIKEWIVFENEADIAKKLGVAQRSFERYKAEHPELVEVLNAGRQDLVTELKATLKKKAQGFYYTETKTQIREEGKKKVRTVEEVKHYSPPDLGAIHLLLKNLDPTWRNDDQTTIDLKKEKMQLEKEKADNNSWT